MKGQELKRRLARAGLNQADLAAFMSKYLQRPTSIKAVSRIVTGDRARISVEESAAIEAFFEENNAGGYMAPQPDRVANAMAQAHAKIPLYGLAAGSNGQDGIAYNSDSVLDWLDAPMLNIDAAFRVAGSSMEPRLFAGETVYVKLGVPPKRGDDAVIEMREEGAGVLIKTFEKIADGYIFLNQWNPVREIRLKYSDVRALHTVRLRA